MNKKKIWISDLTHTAQGISANTFPLGASYVAAYTKKELNEFCDVRLFKFPSHLSKALKEELPDMLCFSNFSWNFELAYKFADLVKKIKPGVVTVFGGPNFPTLEKEKLEFLKKRPSIDFYIELEGELAFVDLTKCLLENNFEISKIKKNNKKILNTCYLFENELVSGPLERIKNINVVPSPYLEGILDEFFEHPLIPMVETTRGCPFACSFCCDGLATKNKVCRYEPTRIEEELYYIAKKVKNVDELVITDLNFAMYKQDIPTAKVLQKIQEKYNYPRLIGASAGKNMPKRTIEVTNIIKGWTTGASIQSTDKEVLNSINRSNISTEAYRELIDHANKSENQKSHSEIILGLPSDSKQKHYESLRFGVDNKVNSLRMFQAMMLVGTEMASETYRKKYDLKTMFRTIPGCLGNYKIFEKEYSVAEIEEIIVGNNTLSREDYLECRIMNLIVETFYNNSIFEEIFKMLRSIEISPFDCLLYIKEHKELYSESINKIIKNFVFQTTEDLYETFDEANAYVLSPDIINKYVGGEMGVNELLLNRALLFEKFDDICDLIFKAAHSVIKENNMMTENINSYLSDLKKFITLRKKDPLQKTEKITSDYFNYDFEQIIKDKFETNPNSLKRLENSVELSFFHSRDQIDHIKNQVKLYSNQSVGLGKLLQKSNLQSIFRRFKRTEELTS